MSEPIWCDITIKIPASWWPEGDDKPMIVRDLWAALINGDGQHDPSGDGGLIVTSNGEGNYGLHDSYVTDVLDWCEKHRVPYTASDETKYDMPGETRHFDGTNSWSGMSAADTYVLPVHEWESMMAEAGDDHFALVRKVTAYFAKMRWSVEGADISHLPSEYPEEDDE